jgi:sensor histidine kinase YesM
MFFLGIKKNKPKLYRAIKVFSIYLITIAIAYIAITYFILATPFYMPVWPNVVHRVVTYACFLGIVTKLFTFKTLTERLLIAGSLSIVVMSLFGYLLSVVNAPLSDDSFSVSTYGAMGVMVEILFFQLALSLRTQQIEKEKQRLIIEEDLKVKQLTQAFQQKLSQTEIAALRAQMNPHFIFNCLNSIQYFTARNEADKASDYLAKFSRLIRLVLENSRSDKVTLDNELETLRLYIEMEAMRFRDKFGYQINVNPDIDTEAVQIPPLLIQPFVENAIWHGLMHKEDKGSITIDVTMVGTTIQVVIADDGVGRQKAAEIKSKSATKNKSFGMKVTAERIELINQMYNINTQVSIEDLQDQNHQPAGTKVIINIPI